MVLLLRLLKERLVKSGWKADGHLPSYLPTLLEKPVSVLFSYDTLTIFLEDTLSHTTSLTSVSQVWGGCFRHNCL